VTDEELSTRFTQLREYVDSAVFPSSHAMQSAWGQLDEAPRLRSVIRRRRVILPLVAAAAVVATALSVALTTDDRTSRQLAPAVSTAVTDPALTCPAAAPTTSSQKDLYPFPSPGPNPLTITNRLVPTSTPTHAVVCGYVNRLDTTLPTKLATSRTIDDGLANIATTLAYDPPEGPGRPCADDIEAHDWDSYLIGLDYPTGTIWISAPGNHCLGASNGRFVTNDHVADSVMTALASGVWPDPKQTTEADCQRGVGRLGQQSAMIPDTPVSLVVCDAFDGNATVNTTPAQLHAVVAALDRLPTAPDSAFQCTGVGGSSDTYTLTFQYSVGPSVTVSVYVGCSPAVHNGSLEATDGSAVLLEIQRIFNH
jgi:hypothetical protein